MPSFHFLPQPLKTGFSLKKFIHNLLSRRWIRFGIVGGAATIIYFFCGIILVKWLGLPLLLGNLLAYLAGFIVSYTGQKKWTFESGARVYSSLPRFVLAQVAGLGLNSLVIDFTVGIGISYELAMGAATFIAALAVYFICKLWVFPKNEPSK